MQNLAIFQYGDFREAVERFDAGGEENFRNQRRSVDFVRGLAGQFPVTVISVSAEPYDSWLTPSLRTIGLPVEGFFSRRFGHDMLHRLTPDAVIAALPHRGLLHALADRRIPTLANFADVFRWPTPRELLHRSGLRRIRDNFALRRSVNQPNVTAVCNRSLIATRSLHQVLGVPMQRVIACEHPAIVPVGTPKTLPQGRSLSLVYAGTLSRSKGVADLLNATARLVKQGRAMTLRLAGDGPEASMLQAHAAQLGLGAVAEFVGRVPNARVRELMAEADIVVVPSRHDYDEGLPNVISEGLASHTPVIVSDHPAYAARFVADRDVVMFPADDADQLADAIIRLSDSPALYRALSERSAKTLDGLFFGTCIFTILQSFVDDPRDRSGWVRRFSMAEGKDKHCR